MIEAAVLRTVQNVLFATDFSPATAAAFSYAVGIASRYQAKLVVGHVISLDSFELLDDDAASLAIGQARAEAHRRISQLLEPLRLPHGRYEIVVGQGVISESLLDMVERHQI